MKIKVSDQSLRRVVLSILFLVSVLRNVSELSRISNIN